MRAVILANEAFSYSAEVRPLDAPTGSYNFAITSLFAGASAHAPRTVFQVSLDRAGLLALRDLINFEVEVAQ
jgi:hypothetical protein